MPKKKTKDTAPNRPDVLDQLSAEDARAVLRILAQDETLTARIRQVAATYLEGNAPHEIEDAQAIAEEIRWELEQLEVEEVWDRAGQTRHGYVETSEVADEMIQRVLDPYLEDMTRYQRLGMILEATYLCMGLLQGLYAFEHESKAQFKEWATDLPLAHAEMALDKWRDGKPASSAVKKMQTFIQEHLLHWEFYLRQSLSKGE